MTDDTLGYYEDGKLQYVRREGFSENAFIDRALDSSRPFDRAVLAVGEMSDKDFASALELLRKEESIRSGKVDLPYGATRFKHDFRDSMLSASDKVCARHGVSAIEDRDLPSLFKNIDALSDDLWLRRRSK